MKTRFIFRTILIFLLALNFLNAQSRLQQAADEMFSKFAYSKAIPLYEELAIEGSNSNHAFMRLAECYLLMREYEKSLPYFKRFINSANTPSSYFFKYAMALQSVGKDDDAADWLKRYKKFNKKIVIS